jgi:glycosyltransferase involved in cell wall biosynthesis
MHRQATMKIAFVSDVIYPYVKGGVEKRVWEVAVRLAKRGHEVHLFGMKYWEGDDILIRDGVILHGVCPSRPLYAGGKRTVEEACNFGLRLIPHLGRYRFDIIDCQQFPFFSCFSAKFLAIIKRTPLVITWHEVWDDYWYDYLGYQGVFGTITERFVSRIMSDTIAVSETTAGRLRRLSPGLRPVVIPNGIDLAEIATARPSEKRSDLIFAGRLIREKHVDLLIAATELLMPQFPDLKVLIIGDGPERDRIQSLIRARGLEGSVTLKRFCEDHQELISLFRSSKVFILPSTREGFGITALEALACGLPVVTIDHPANAVRDLITERNGFLSSLSTEDCAEKIRGALGHHREMREACIANAAAYDWDRIAAECEEYYRSVITKTGAKGPTN